jgi:bacterial/archaeal transporter family-2 protein
MSRGFMQWITVVSIAGALLAGVLIPVQTGYNMQLARAVHGPMISALAVFAIGFVFLAAIALVMRVSTPSVKEAATAPLVSWFAGGVLAAVYVILLIVLAPRLWAATTIAFVVVGQIACSIAIDHFGLLGFAERAATPPGLAGFALMVAGVTLVRLF